MIPSPKTSFIIHCGVDPKSLNSQDTFVADFVDASSLWQYMGTVWELEAVSKWRIQMCNFTDIGSSITSLFLKLLQIFKHCRNIDELVDVCDLIK